MNFKIIVNLYVHCFASRETFRVSIMYKWPYSAPGSLWEMRDSYLGSKVLPMAMSHHQMGNCTLFSSRELQTAGDRALTSMGNRIVHQGKEYRITSSIGAPYTLIVRNVIRVSQSVSLFLKKVNFTSSLHCWKFQGYLLVRHLFPGLSVKKHIIFTL